MSPRENLRISFILIFFDLLPMIATSRLNNENEIILYILRLNKGGLDKSSPYINIRELDKSSPYINIRGLDKSSPYNSTGELDESSPCINKKMGMMNQALTELTIIPGGIK